MNDFIKSQLEIHRAAQDQDKQQLALYDKLILELEKKICQRSELILILEKDSNKSYSC
jgi:hypothetical protein